MASPGPSQNFGRSRSEDARSAPVTIVRLPVAGLAIVLSLVLGFIVGVLDYRYFARHGKPRGSVPASAARATTQPVAENQPVSMQPVADGRFEVRKVDFRLVDSNPEITLLLSQTIAYDAHRLEQPDRVYIDLHGAHLARELKGATISINKGGVSRIRLAQTQSDAVRVVVDLEKRFDYSLTTGRNPTALVVRLRPHAADVKQRAPGPS